MLRDIVVVILLANFAASDGSQCYRCFGSTWCNNFTDPAFISNVAIINCPTSTNSYDYEGNSPLISRLLKRLEAGLNQVNTFEESSQSTWGCVTATLHDGHEVNTLRTCLNNATTICPTVRNVVLNSDVNDISPDMKVECAGCTDTLCNDQTFDDESDTDTDEPDTNTTTPTVAPITTTTTMTTVSPIITTSPDPPATTTTVAPPIITSPDVPDTTTTKTVAPTITTSPDPPAPTITTTVAPTTTTIPPGDSDTGPGSTTEVPIETTTDDAGHSIIVSHVVLIVAVAVDFFIF